MQISKKIYISNIISYISFVVYSMLSFENKDKGIYVIFAFLPYLTVAFTTFVFNFKFDKRLKKIISLTISDFLVRVIALFINFYLTSTKFQVQEYRIIIIVLIILFLINVLIEYFIEKKLIKIKFNIENNELSPEEIIANGSHKAIFLEVSSIKETIILYIIILLIWGYNSSAMYIVFYSIIFICLVILYIKFTYSKLLNYYRDKSIAVKFFLKENLGIFLMLTLMVLYSIFIKQNGIFDFIIYIILNTFMLPRYICRRRRLEQVYKTHITK